LDGVLTESSVAAPASLYGSSKLAGTMAVSSARERTNLRAVTARLFTVYGPGEHEGRLLPSLIEASRTGGEVKLTMGQQKRDFTYVSDAVEGLLRLSLIAENAPPVVNLATGKLTPVRAFAECAAEVLALRESQLEFGALPEQQDELRQGPADTHLVRELVGWVPTCTPREGITRTMEFATGGAERR
jgi:UDP-glucose 4-epimerase